MVDNFFLFSVLLIIKRHKQGAYVKQFQAQRDVIVHLNAVHYFTLRIPDGRAPNEIIVHLAPSKRVY